MVRGFLAVLAVFAVCALPASAARAPVATFALTYEFYANTNSHYPADEPNCLHEDFEWARAWGGFLPVGLSFVQDIQFCDYYTVEGVTCAGLALPTPECPFGGGGGDGVAYDLYFDPRLHFDFHVVQPDGSIRDSKRLADDNGRVHLQGCVVPQVTREDNSVVPVVPGTYRLVVQNTDAVLPKGKPLQDTLLGIWIDMAVPEWQAGHCP